MKNKKTRIQIRDSRYMIKKLFHFILINTLIFIHPLISSYGAYPITDVYIMFAIFAFTLLLEMAILFVFTRFIKHATLFILLQLFFLALNVYNFNTILNSFTIFENVLLLCAVCAVFLFLIYKNSIKASIFLSVLFISILIINSIVIPSFQKDEPIKLQAIESQIKAKRNIFVVGFDAMVSRAISLKYFGTERAPKTLDSLGFATKDLFSPANATVSTYASLISYKKKIPARKPGLIFWDINSQFYKDSKALGYKKQFIFYTDYFGTDDTQIYDDYFPKRNSFCNFCSYIDNRWAWGFCKMYIKYANPAVEKASDLQFYFNRIDKIFNDTAKWYSICHIWFPGHTLQNYNATNRRDFSNYRKYYAASEDSLSKMFVAIKHRILSRDSTAIIVFMGDHGTSLLKGSKEGDIIDQYGVVKKDDIFRDQREVLLAIYPKKVGNTVFRNMGSNTNELFRHLLLEGNK